MSCPNHKADSPLCPSRGLGPAKHKRNLPRCSEHSLGLPRGTHYTKPKASPIYLALMSVCGNLASNAGTIKALTLSKLQAKHACQVKRAVKTPKPLLCSALQVEHYEFAPGSPATDLTQKASHHAALSTWGVSLSEMETGMQQSAPGLLV